MMKSELRAYLFVTAGLLPGELGVTLAVMMVDYEFNPLILAAWAGIWMTVNFFIAAGFQNHVANQQEKLGED